MRADWSMISLSYALSLMRIFSLATYVPPLSGASRPANSSSLYLYDSARTHSVATLTDGEAQALVHGHGGDKLHVHLRVVSGHHHLGPLGQGDGPGHVCGAEVELGAVAGDEGGMAPTLVLGEHVDLATELGVGGYAA